MTTTISTGQDIATLINVFTVDPDNQEQLVDLLDKATTRSSGIVQDSSPQTSTRAWTAPES